MNPNFKSLVKPEELESLNAKVKEKGTLDREHLLLFLTLIPTANAEHIKQEVKNWLTTLHNDKTYTTVVFPPGHIDMVLGDLESYGRVHPKTILRLKESQND